MAGDESIHAVRTDAGGRLRLAFVCHCLRPGDGGAGRIGGAERAAAELLAALRARDDVEVRLLAASAASDRLGFLGFAVRTLVELEGLARAGEIHAVLFNGADLERFAAPPPFEARRGILSCAFPAETQGLADEDLVICAVGRQVERKGHAWFVREVMPKLAAGARLWLAGDGPEAAAIAAAAGQAGVEDRVLRLGAIPEPQLHALYRGADLMVMPNVPVAGDIEGFGLVLLEANLNGLPVVCADIEGPAGR